MKFTPYWVKETREINKPTGDTFRVSAWGWSDVSESDAGIVAARRAQDAVEAFSRGEPPASTYYDERPVREEVLKEFSPEGNLDAAISRNSYGARILNTARMMFIDVDLVDPADYLPIPGFLRSLFGLKAAESREEQVQTALTSLKSWLQMRPEWGVRVYETHSGLRYLITHAEISPESSESESVLVELQADPRYRTLCKTQACFRARLTPKPWRIGMSTPPVQYPYFNAEDRSLLEQWEHEYQERSKEVSVCSLLDVLGQEAIYPGFEEYIEAHDRETGVESSLPLA